MVRVSSSKQATVRWWPKASNACGSPGRATPIAHLGAVLLRVIADRSDIPMEDIGLPQDLPGQVALCRSLGLHLIYDHQAHTVTTSGRHKLIVVSVR